MLGLVERKGAHSRTKLLVLGGGGGVSREGEEEGEGRRGRRRGKEGEKEKEFSNKTQPYGDLVSKPCLLKFPAHPAVH